MTTTASPSWPADIYATLKRHDVRIAAYVPELFPTEIRLRGVGLCSTTGRLANVGIPFLIALLYTQGGVTAVLALISGGLLVQGLVVAAIGVETKGLALEDVSGGATAPMLAEAPAAR